MATIRMLATENIWAPHNHIGGGESPDVEWLDRLESPTPPVVGPLWRPARQQVLAGETHTNYAPDNQPYDTVPRGSLPLPGELPSTWDLTTMNVENYSANTVALSTRLPFALGGLVGDGEWAMGLARSAHGHEWGGLFYHSGGLRPGHNIYRVKAAWLTWRQIPVPGWLQPVVQRAHHPPVPHHSRAPMETRPWPRQPTALRPRRTTGPGPTNPAGQLNSTPAHSLGGTGNPGDPARAVRPSGPSQGRKTHLRQRGLWYHHCPTH